jgi:hypothetical protein
MKVKELLRESIKYIRELSIIVVGISITFLADDWIKQSKDKKDLQYYLEAVHNELNLNLECTQRMFDDHTQAEALGRYLRSTKPGHINKDSIQRYNNVISGRPISLYQKNAFEMLKISGTMHLIKDKAISKSIMDVYSLIEANDQIGETFFAARQDLLTEIIINSPNTTFEEVVEDLSAPQYRRLYNFHSMQNDTSSLFQYCIGRIETTMEMLQKELN